MPALEELFEDDLGEQIEQGMTTVTPDGELVVGGFRLSPTGLVPIGRPDFEDWDRLGHFLRYIHTGTQFWLGDWLNYGETSYGERYSQAVEHTGYELHTLQSYAWVARNVPPDNRNESVPFGHYMNGIAAIKEPAEQRKWVQKVVEKQLTQAELRAQLNEDRARKGEKPVDLWLVVLCRDQDDFNKMEKRMRSEGREVTTKVTARKKARDPEPKLVKPKKKK